MKQAERKMTRMARPMRPATVDPMMTAVVESVTPLDDEGAETAVGEKVEVAMFGKAMVAEGFSLDAFPAVEEVGV